MVCGFPLSPPPSHSITYEPAKSHTEYSYNTVTFVINLALQQAQTQCKDNHSLCVTQTHCVSYSVQQAHDVMPYHPRQYIFSP